jgi:hypothetical protein
LFSRALSGYLDHPVPLRFADWDEAVTFLFSPPQLGTAVVVLDEFPYLSNAMPALPSIIQREVDRAASRGSGPSLLLCGSALSVMGRLFTSTGRRTELASNGRQAGRRLTQATRHRSGGGERRPELSALRMGRRNAPWGVPAVSRSG